MGDKHTDYLNIGRFLLNIFKSCYWNQLKLWDAWVLYLCHVFMLNEGECCFTFALNGGVWSSLRVVLTSESLLYSSTFPTVCYFICFVMFSSWIWRLHFRLCGTYGSCFYDLLLKCNKRYCFTNCLHGFTVCYCTVLRLNLPSFHEHERSRFYFYNSITTLLLLPFNVKLILVLFVVYSYIEGICN